MSARRLTPTATLVLSVLNEQPMHPYEVLCRLTKRRDDRLVRLNPGAVYHAIDRLGRDGYVVESGVDRAGNRPERTTYTITGAGREALSRRAGELVSEHGGDYPPFPVGLALIHDLSAAEAVDRLRARRQAIAQSIEGSREQLDSVVARGLPRRFVLDGYYEIHQAEAAIEWLDATLAAIESGEIDWSQTPTAEFGHTLAAQSLP